MEYTKRRKYTINPEVNDLKDIYPHDLQMYDVPPSGEVPFIEFQELGLDRLKLLQLVESNAIKDFEKSEERKSDLRTSLLKDGLKYFDYLLFASGCTSTESTLQARRKDRLSHFIMRLSYCQDPVRQAWFINQEVEFFKLRFSSLDKDGREQLLNMHDINCKQISPEEKEEFREELRVSTPRVTNIDTTEFYKVPFQRVTDLVRGRRAYLREGFAYVSQSDLVSLFLSYFRKNLIEGMEYAKIYLSNISDDERLMSFLKSLPGSFSGMTRVVWSTNTTPIEKLDELSKTSYPLCMRMLHEALRTNHHLKHNGRIQYGLFLKGIGVTLDDSLRFWRSEFTKKIDPDKFDKQYAYSVRYNYGKEGKQTNYTPFGCPKIISGSVGPGEHHGCPYKHMDYDLLKQKLSSYGLPPASVNEIAILAKDSHYYIACKQYFKAHHNQEPEKPIIHPNSYFMESRTIMCKDETVSEADTTDRFSQSMRLSGVNGTPRRSDRFNESQSRSAERVNNTPSRTVEKVGTPSRPAERAIGTPVRRLSKNPPKRIDIGLNAEEIAELMEDI